MDISAVAIEACLNMADAEYREVSTLRLMSAPLGQPLSVRARYVLPLLGRPLVVRSAVRNAELLALPSAVAVADQHIPAALVPVLAVRLLPVDHQPPLVLQQALDVPQALLPILPPAQVDPQAPPLVPRPAQVDPPEPPLVPQPAQVDPPEPLPVLPLVLVDPLEPLLVPQPAQVDPPEPLPVLLRLPEVGPQALLVLLRLPRGLPVAAELTHRVEVAAGIRLVAEAAVTTNSHALRGSITFR